MTKTAEHMENADKRRSLLYKLAKSKGLKLEISRSRDPEDRDYQTYRILNRRLKEVVHAARAGGYGLTLGQVEQFLVHQVVARAYGESESKAAAANPKQASQVTSDPEQEPSKRTPARGDQLQPIGSSGEALVIADATIPAHIVALYNVILIWAAEAANAREAQEGTKGLPNRGSGGRFIDYECEECQFLKPYFEAYRMLTKYSAHQTRLYMFAKLLGVARAV